MKKIKTVKKKHLKDGETFFDMFTGFYGLKMKFKKRSSLIVADLELINGDSELHVVEVEQEHFKLLGGMYLVHEKYLKYNRTLRMWVGKYHQKLSLPIDQSIDTSKHKKNGQPLNTTIPAKDIKKMIADSTEQGVIDVVNNVDPNILVNFVKTQIIQKVFAGEEMANVFGFIKIMLIVILIGVGIACAILLGGVV